MEAPTKAAHRSPAGVTRRAQEAATLQNPAAQKAAAAFQALRQLHTLYKAGKALCPQAAGSQEPAQAEGTADSLLAE